MGGDGSGEWNMIRCRARGLPQEGTRMQGPMRMRDDGWCGPACFPPRKISTAAGLLFAIMVGMVSAGAGDVAVPDGEIGRIPEVAGPEI